MAIHNISKCIGVTTATCLRWGLLGREPEAGLGRDDHANTDVRLLSKVHSSGFQKEEKKSTPYKYSLF